MKQFFRIFYSLVFLTTLSLLNPFTVQALNTDPLSCNFRSMSGLGLNVSGLPSAIDADKNFNIVAQVTVPAGYRTSCSNISSPTIIFRVNSKRYEVGSSKLSSGGQFVGFKATQNTSYADVTGSTTIQSGQSTDTLTINVALQDSAGIIEFPGSNSVTIRAVQGGSSGGSLPGGESGNGGDNGSGGSLPGGESGNGGSTGLPGGQSGGSGGQTGTGSGSGSAGAGCAAGSSTLCNPIKYDNLVDLFFAIMKYMLLAIGALTVAMLIYGGFQMVLSRGNESSLTQAKSTLTYAVIGLIIAMLSFSIVSIIQNIIGVK